LERPEPTKEHPQGVCVDKGYDDDEVRDLLAACGFTAHLRARGEEAKALKQEAGFRACRGGVGRTQSWMNRFRLVVIHWDKKDGMMWRFCIWRVPILRCGSVRS
jgi:putative transposase